MDEAKFSDFVVCEGKCGLVSIASNFVPVSERLLAGKWMARIFARVNIIAVVVGRFNNTLVVGFIVLINFELTPPR